MARGNLSACLAVTLVHEGGYVDHPSDPGGATNMGITHKTLRSYRHANVTKQDVKNLTIGEATAIYEQNYWRPIRGDDLPYGVDLGTFDGAVNSGPSRGAKWLQRAVGVKQDGKIGPETLRSAAADDGDRIVRLMCGYRLSFVQGLGTFKVFGKGWSRRIADIEARGVAMWLRYGAGKSAGQVATELQHEADKAGTTAGDQSNGAKAGGAGGAGVSATDYFTDGSGWLIVVGAVFIALSLYLFVKSRQNRERSAAYRSAVMDQELDAMAGQ